MTEQKNNFRFPNVAALLGGLLFGGMGGIFVWAVISGYQSSEPFTLGLKVTLAGSILIGWVLCTAWIDGKMRAIRGN